MRSDGKRVHMEDPLEELAPYFMKHRYDAMNMVEEDIPLEPIRKYLNAKRAEGMALTHLDVITAAYVRIASEFEFLNLSSWVERSIRGTSFPFRWSCSSPVKRKP